MTEIQSDKNIKKCRQFINDLFVSCGGEKMKYVERHIYKINHNLKLERDVHFITDQYFSVKQENMVNSMNNKMAESEWKEHELMRNFKPECMIQLGQRLESIPDLEKLQGDRVMRNYPIEDGRIYIIYLWTIYNTVCKKQLKFLNDLYDINHVWEGNVKLISINSDLNRDIAKKLTKTQNLVKMDHLYFDCSKYPNHPLLNLVQKNGYPLCLLVNNDNIIDFCGSLYNIDLQKSVSALLLREKVSSANVLSNEVLSIVEKKTFKEILYNLKNNCGMFRYVLKAPHLCGATIKVKKIYTATSSQQFNKVKEILGKKGSRREEQKSSLSHIKRQMTKLQKSDSSSNHQDKGTDRKRCEYLAVIEFFCHEKDDHIFDNLFSGIDQVPKVKIEKQYVKTEEIFPAKVNSLCYVCNNSTLTSLRDLSIRDEGILEDSNFSDELDLDSQIIVSPQYYCSKCEIHICKNCGDHLSDLNYPNQVHNHHLYYLHNNNRLYAKYILAYNFENNYDFDFKYYQENTKTPKYINDIKNHYQVSCDACKCFPITTQRWKCCNCIFKNICDNCKLGAENTEDSNYPIIIKNLEIQGCDARSHVFMKIVFDSFVY